MRQATTGEVRPAADPASGLGSPSRRDGTGTAARSIQTIGAAAASVPLPPAQISTPRTPETHTAAGDTPPDLPGMVHSQTARERTGPWLTGLQVTKLHKSIRVCNIDRQLKELAHVAGDTAGATRPTRCPATSRLSGMSGAQRQRRCPVTSSSARLSAPPGNQRQRGCPVNSGSA